jgi:hypothetical protein
VAAALTGADRKSGDKRGDRKLGSLHGIDSIERRGERHAAESRRQALKALTFRLFPSDPHARAAGTPTGGSIFCHRSQIDSRKK